MKANIKEVVYPLIRTVPAIAIGGLVLLEVLRRNGGIRTPQQRGGWTEIGLEEFEESPIEKPSNVIHLFPILGESEAGGIKAEPKIIDVDDIPGSLVNVPRLTVINKLIDVEDIPRSLEN